MKNMKKKRKKLQYVTPSATHKSIKIHGTRSKNYGEIDLLATVGMLE